MRLLSNLLLSVALLSAAALATENFGGIGIAMYKSNRGVSVAGIAKGSPADAAGLIVGDCITEVDGKSLRGKSVADVKGMIRGTSGKPVTLKVLRSGEYLDVDVERVEFSVVNVKDEKEADEVKCSNCELLDVVATKEKSAGFYIKKADAPAFSEIKTTEILKSVNLVNFTRQKFAVKSKSTASFSVSMYQMDGAFVKRMDVHNTKKGTMDVRWDNTTLPSGQYTIEITQDGKKNRFVKRLY